MCLTVPGKFDRLTEIAAFVTQAARTCGLNDDDVFHVEMAVDEACSNIIEHAYAGEAGRDFRLHCEFKDGKLVMTFHDRGKSFDFKNVDQPDLTASLSERKVGGLGIYLMHKLMDEVDYKIARSGNFLTLIKRKD